MTDRLPGKYLEKLHTKPWFHGGHVPEIKYSYSVAGLTPSQYPIKVRSLLPGVSAEKNPRAPKKIFPNADDPKPPINFREFREYSFLRENEVIVTIEHCDNCESHLETTRHDPEKYAGFAQSIKSGVLTRFPMVKVLIKPISKCDDNTTNQRMGAFEVQICSKIKGIIKKDTLHSKLATRKWPDIREVIGKMANYLPTCQLFVTIYDYSDQEKFLKGIKVVVRPKALPIAIPALSRPRSANFASMRPQSAGTTMSVRSIRFSSRKESRPTSHYANKPKPTEVISYERTTDRDGSCLFANIPLDIYEIEVCETKEFKGATKLFNTFEEPLQNSSLNVYIAVQSREISAIKIVLKDPELKTEVAGAMVRISRGSGEMYFVPEMSRGVYELSIPKGNYDLSIQAEGYQEIVKSIQANQAEIVMTELLRSRENREVQIMTYDALSGEPLGSVYLELRINENNSPLEGLAKSGSFTYLLDEIGMFTLSASKQGYMDAQVTLKVSTKGNTIIAVGLVPIPRPELSYLVFSWTRCSDDLEIEAIGDNLLLSLRSPNGKGCQFIDMLKSHGIATICITPECGDLRVMAKSLSKELLEGKDNDKAPLLSSGFSVNYYARQKQEYNIIPSYGKGSWWDIGVYFKDRNDFIETNVITDEKLTHWGDYFSVFHEIINLAESSDSISAVFGFDQSGVSKQTDYGRDKFVSPEILRKILSIKCNDDGLQYAMRSFITPNGVSLAMIRKRYEKHRKFQLQKPSRFQSVDTYARFLGMDSIEDKGYYWIAQEALGANLPEGWEVVSDSRGYIKYRHIPSGQYSTDHPNPNDEYYRNKFLDEKQKAIKEAEISKEFSREERSLLEEVKFSQSHEKEEKQSSSSEGEQEQAEEAEEENVQEFIEIVNKQCKELCDLVEEKMTQAMQTGIDIDIDTRGALLEKILEYAENLEKLKSEVEDKEALNFVKNWILEFGKLHKSLIDFHVDGEAVKGAGQKKEKSDKKHKKSSSSSSSSSSNSSKSHSSSEYEGDQYDESYNEDKVV
ncbi:unnamed protein product [Blepharisma stoltei]|uniref:Uncharacterized protein n=1 Tax=Blepharisma stoltei TaxID=1481888 RepID=A0AAU9IV51_9CILI|nr:unnamed protein product [Blepharisma stoltei]